MQWKCLNFMFDITFLTGIQLMYIFFSKSNLRFLVQVCDWVFAHYCDYLYSCIIVYSPLFTGDKQYPPDTSGQTEADRTPNHEQKNPENRSALHRMMVKDSYTTTLHVTIKPKYKHLLPVMEPSSSQGTKSQLWLQW